MSFNFYLYRAATGLPPMHEWEDMHAEPLGDVEEAKRKLDIALGSLRWEVAGDGWNGLGADQARCHLDVWLNPDDGGMLRFIVMNKAPPSAMRKVCEAFDLNYVAAPEAGDLVDVYACDDTDRHYVAKTSNR